MWADLVCPVDRAALAWAGDQLACTICGRSYPVVDRIPRLLPGEDGAAWRNTQRRDLALLPAKMRSATDPASRQLLRRGRLLELHFQRLCRVGAASRILQIGGVGEAEIHHFRHGVRYLVDPLAGEYASRAMLAQEGVRWVAARGEDLPFARGTFTAILLGEVLDSVESPERVLAEVARCLSADGLIWVSAARNRTCWPRLAMHDVSNSSEAARTSGEQVLNWCRKLGFAPAWQHEGELDGPGVGPVRRNAASSRPVHLILERCRKSAPGAAATFRPRLLAA